MTAEEAWDLQDEEPQLNPLAAAVRSAVAPFRVAAGEVVVRQGDEGRHLYLVDEGALDVVITTEEGVRLPVARLGPGSHFGEMSLMTGAPVSADVVASEESLLHAIPAEGFHQLVQSDPDLLEHMAGELAERLKRTNEQLGAEQARQTALGKLLSSQPGTPLRTDLPSLTAKLREAVDAAIASDAPLLIGGEEGVGKRALAQHIHAAGHRQERPILVVDCRQLPPDQASRQLFGDAEPASVTRFADHLGYIQAANGGTLVLAHVDRLSDDVQHDLATFLTHHPAGGNDVYVDVRVIATCTDLADAGQTDGALAEPLRLALTGDTSLHLRPLRKRRRDIVPLAEHSLAENARREGRPPKALSESARRALVGYDFAFGNVAELKRVVELADRLADGEVVSGEHLFFGPGSDDDAVQLDLLNLPWFARVVLGGRVLPALKAVVALVFLGIVAACLVLPNSSVGWWANLMVWGLWWPGLVLSMLLLGRAWCAVCPLGSAGQAAKRVGGRELEPPDRLKRIGAVVALVGFVLIVWIEQATAMAENPTHTAVLLIALALTAVVVGWLYQRHTWCRYLCPLGAMGAVLAVAPALRIRARKEVCAGSCTGNECYKGSSTTDGCPMFTHAMFSQSGQHCKLCMNCVRTCPHGAARLVMRLPLSDIWRSSLISTEMAPLVVVIGLLALLLAATPAIGLASGAGKWWFAGGSLGIVVVGLALVWLLHDRQQTENDVLWTARTIYAYAPAAAGLLFAFHLHSLPWLGDSALRLTMPGGAELGLSLLQLGQWAVALASSLMTLGALWKLCRAKFGPTPLRALVVWSALGLLAIVCVTQGVTWLS